MPFNFLTRYNTTEDSCECPDMRWAIDNYWNYENHKCKHIKVLNGGEYDSSMKPKEKTPRPILVGWKSKKALETAREHSVIHGDINSHYVKLWDVVYNISMRNRVQYYGVSEIKSYVCYRDNVYKTTHSGCDCPSRKYEPSIKCKHMVLYSFDNPLTRVLPVVTHFSTKQPELIEDVASLNKEFQKLNTEKRELKIKEANYKHKVIEDLNVCFICYNKKSIQKCLQCSKGYCVDCYYEIEKRKYKEFPCPYCRAPMKSLLDILYKKFSAFEQ